MKTKYIILSIAAAVIFSAIIFSGYYKTKKVKFANKRIIDNTLKIRKSFGVGFSANEFKEVVGGGFVLKNSTTQEVVLLNSSKKVIQTLKPLPVKRGRPFISDFGLINSQIYSADPNNRIVTFASGIGDTKKNYKVDISFNRMILIDDSTCIMQQVNTSEKDSKLNFCKYNFKSKLKEDLNEINFLFQQSKYSGIVYDGFFTTNGNGSYYYVCYLTNKIISFDKSGHLLFNKKAIYDVTEPKVIAQGKYLSTGESVITTSSISANKKFLYVLSNIGDKLYKDDRLIDIYNAVDGTYIKSYVAPNNNGNLPNDINAGYNALYLGFSGSISSLNKW
jgi:hypothetical protein